MTTVVAQPAESTSTGRSGARRPRRPRRTAGRRTIVVAVLAYVIAMIFILPYAEMVVTALRPKSELTNAGYFPQHWDFSNFTSIWKIGFGKNLGASLEIAAGATVLVLLVALPAAYYTARKRFFGRSVFLLLVLATQMFQPAAMLVGLQREFISFNLPNPVISLILVDAGFNLAFAVWILNAYFSSIPAELEEAAMVDGTGRFGAMTRITLPLALPGIVTALIFTFIGTWNELIVALTLTLGAPASQTPLTVAINNFIGQYSVDWGHLFAAAVIATLPVIVLFAVIEGRVVSGLTAGSIK